MKQANRRPSDHPGRFAYGGVERALQERTQLGVIASLAIHLGVLESVVADAAAIAGNTIVDEGKLGEGWAPA
jgi:hypothetical protein